MIATGARAVYQLLVWFNFETKTINLIKPGLMSNVAN